MPLTEEQTQRYNALLRYPKAINAMKLINRDLFESVLVSDEEKRDILCENGVLLRMTLNHDRYERLLALLNQDERARVLLGCLCDKLTISPVTELQAFIDKAHQVMLDDVFISNLTALSQAYRNDAFMGNIGAGLVFFAGAAACMLLAPLILDLWIIALAFGIALLSTFLLIKGLEFSGKSDDLNNEIFLFTDEKPLNKSCSSLTTQHKAIFFQPRLSSRDPLNIVFQKIFNSLSETPMDRLGDNRIG